MLTRPEGLSDDDVAEAVHRGWGLDVMAVEHLPVGFGSHHWKVVGPGHRSWFITVDDLAPLRTADMTLGRLQAALMTARQLRERGLSFVVAPVPDCDEVVVRRVGDRWAMAVYPYVDGRSEPSGRYRSADDLRAVLELLVELHAVAPDRTAARTHDFAIRRRDDLERALTQFDEPWIGGPHAEPARELLASRSTDVERRLRRLDHLAAEARARPDHRVITHGEPHAGNSLHARDGWMLVDWDSALVAPPERDLWALAGSDDAVIEAYTATTGRAVQPALLELYELTWDLTEIALAIATFRGPHERTADTNQMLADMGEALRRN